MTAAYSARCEARPSPEGITEMNTFGWSEEDELRAGFIASKMSSSMQALIAAQITFHLDDVDETHASLKAIASDVKQLVTAWNEHRRRAIARAKSGGHQ